DPLPLEGGGPRRPPRPLRPRSGRRGQGEHPPLPGGRHPGAAGDQEVVTGSSRTRLCRTFVDRAVQTWRYVDIGARNRLIPGEETLTDINLLEIQGRHPGAVRIWRFSKWKEGRATGADWEWWIGGSGWWVGMRVQAKNWRPGTTPKHLAARLNYRRGQQLQLLLSSSAQDGLFPLYCLYNGRRRWPWLTCPTCQPSPQAFGCTIVPATCVASALHSGSGAHILSCCRPWSCLVCGQCLGFPTGALAHQIYDSLLPAFETLQFRMSPLREQLPQYILALREGAPPERLPDVARLLLIEEGGE